MKSKKRQIVYGNSSVIEKNGTITISQVRKIGCFRKQYIATKKLVVSELTKEELVALRGMEAYKYVK